MASFTPNDQGMPLGLSMVSILSKAGNATLSLINHHFGIVGRGVVDEPVIVHKANTPPPPPPAPPQPPKTNGPRGPAPPRDGYGNKKPARINPGGRLFAFSPSFGTGSNGVDTVLSAQEAYGKQNKEVFAKTYGTYGAVDNGVAEEALDTEVHGFPIF